ncbi:MAG: GNAT family N-acetyltransferase [Elusimicrobiales bacterium]|nr:GNAT family N-acetyltransferase [Elusimicrobiales bacterium]
MRVRESSIDEFIEYSYNLYSKCKNWVGDLKKNLKRLLSDQHPFWSFSEKKLFVVEENGLIKGRIAAIINQRHNSFWNERCCFFGFFDCENDNKVAELLFGQVESFSKEKGMSIIRGPANPSSNYSWGLLVDNFDAPNCIMMPYNYSYYENLIIQNGYKKEKDLYAYEWDIASYSSYHMSLFEKISKNNKDIVIESADLSDFEKVFNDVKKVYNRAWEKNWGFIPMTDEEIREMANTLKSVIKSDYLIFARNGNDEAVGFSLILPDLNIPLSVVKGKINIFNFIPFLYKYLFKINKGRVLTLGVIDNYRGKGIEVLIIKKAIEIAKKYGWQKGELSWTLEDNVKINKTIEKFGGRLYKKYRIFRKDL